MVFFNPPLLKFCIDPRRALLSVDAAGEAVVWGGAGGAPGGGGAVGTGGATGAGGGAGTGETSSGGLWSFWRKRSCRCCRILTWCCYFS